MHPVFLFPGARRLFFVDAIGGDGRLRAVVEQVVQQYLAG